jgi:hypothetical protein
MIRQARTGDTQSLYTDGRWDTDTGVVAGGRRGKDDRKQNTLAPLAKHNK